MERMDMGAAAVEVRALRWNYGDEEALDGVSLSLKAGRFIAIVGPNGSGKTTLVKCIGGELRPQRGCVHVLGRDVLDYSAKRLARIIANVPQQTEILFPMPVTDIVMMGRYPYLKRLRREAEADWQAAREAMRFTQTEYLGERMIDQLSGGERQRVLIARALAQDCPILILDEPISSLDIRHQVEILTLLRRQVDEQGRTAVCVLHDLNLAAAYADDMAVLSGGQVRAFGSVGEVAHESLFEEVYGIRVRRVAANGGRPYFAPEYGHGPRIFREE